jgi:hypothetical protein
MSAQPMSRATAVETMSMAGMQQVCSKECVVKSVGVLNMAIAYSMQQEFRLNMAAEHSSLNMAHILQHTNVQVY